MSLCLILLRAEIDISVLKLLGFVPFAKFWSVSIYPSVYNLLRRGVRSDAQLRPTETRFQKCSQSGKNGSKHPMLSISMAYNVISCKKVERNTQKLKIADFTM